jgi:hypothetical protein
MKTTTAKKPARELWMVENLEKGRSRWTRVGTADENKDGSFTIHLQTTPTPGACLNLRSPPSEAE